jgi:hypothetical protein
MNTEENNTHLLNQGVSDSASRIENFFEDGNFLYRFRGFYV